MSRSPRALALRAVALAIAVLTARTVTLDLRAVHAQAHSLGPLRAVVVARTTLREGHVVQRNDLTTVRRHQSQEPPGTFDRAGAVTGRALAVDVAAGAPLLPANLGAAGNGTSGGLGADERVVRIVDAGGIEPDVGAIVDVYATFDAPSGVTDASDATRLVARGARVLRVDHESTDLRATRTTSGSVGILAMVKASDAPEIASAVANGVVTVAIAPVEDACCADR